MRRATTAFLLAASLLAVTAVADPADAKDRKPPYWASIAAGEANMRTGPAATYPIAWLYRRADLPIRVVGTYPNWRKVEDPTGTTGWMLVSLLSDVRTAIVKPGEPRTLSENPTRLSQVSYRIEPGVVGRVSKCRRGWCRLSVGPRSGFIRTNALWGVDAREEID